MTKREQRCQDFVEKLRTGGTFKVCWSKSGRPRIEDAAGHRLTLPLRNHINVVTVIAEVLCWLFPKDSQQYETILGARGTMLVSLCECLIRFGYMLTFTPDHKGTAIWSVYPLQVFTGRLLENNAVTIAEFHHKNGKWYLRRHGRSVVACYKYSDIFSVERPTVKAMH